uniref:Uncharacterized protein n=1 Tax=Oryza nivara TaxID=4536 RepID=A0A0E0FQS9_ORYNI
MAEDLLPSSQLPSGQHETSLKENFRKTLRVALAWAARGAKNPSRPRLHSFPLTSPLPELEASGAAASRWLLGPAAQDAATSPGMRGTVRGLRVGGGNGALAVGGLGRRWWAARWRGAVASARPPLGLAAVWSALAAGSSFPWLARRSLCSKSSSPSLWGASRHGEGVGRSTRKTQVAKARLFSVLSHRSDSTWRLKGGVAEVAWVSVLGRGGGVVFLVVDQANSVWGAPPLSTGSFLTGWWQWSVDKENSGCRGNVVPCPDSLKSDSTGKPAGGVAEAAWVSYLAEVVGAVAVLSLARLEAGRWWGVGWVWWKPCAADV